MKNSPCLTATALFLIITAMAACNDSTQHAEKTPSKSYEDLVVSNKDIKPASDTIALGFILRQPKSQVEKRFEELVSKGKVGDKEDWETAFMTVKDLPTYNLYLNDSVIVKTHIAHQYNNDSLRSMTFLGDLPLTDVTYTYTDLFEWMKQRFKDPDYTQTDEGGYYHTYYWFDGYKQIQLSKVGTSVFGIEYHDLAVVYKSEEFKKLIDSVKKIVNKSLFDSSKTDFK